MSSAGMNMALGTVSDVFMADSGTRGMFRTRSIGPDSPTVASCIKAMTDGYAAEGHVVFITKHFPGLGNASGNTDVDPTVHTRSSTAEAMELELAPYRAATTAVNAAESAPLFGAMVSHASYPVLDKSGSAGTVSPVILHDFLRAPAETDVPLGGGSFKGMDLKGVTVSDAFWTWGAMKNLSPMEKRRMMARSFLAGMDMLMIAKTDFAGAWDYFQSVFSGELPAAEQQALANDSGSESFAAIQAKFRERVAESAERIAASKKRVGLVATFEKTGEPRAASTDLVDEYRRLTKAE
jgi:beta-glucosidase-like glycosyl hydrolase